VAPPTELQKLTCLGSCVAGQLMETEKEHAQAMELMRDQHTVLVSAGHGA
jgi:hypothetical protein